MFCIAASNFQWSNNSFMASAPSSSRRESTEEVIHQDVTTMNIPDAEAGDNPINMCQPPSPIIDSNVDLVVEDPTCLDGKLGAKGHSHGVLGNPDPTLKELMGCADKSISDVVAFVEAEFSSADCEQMDGDEAGSLELLETQSQYVDGTEDVTQLEDVPAQLEAEKLSKKKKLEEARLR